MYPVWPPVDVHFLVWVFFNFNTLLEKKAGQASCMWAFAARHYDKYQNHLLWKIFNFFEIQGSHKLFK